MANNRMFLVCNVCHPEQPAEFVISSEIPGALHLAKWYPGNDGAYYRNNTAGMGEEFEKFLIDHAHTELPSQGYTRGAGQPNPVRIEYESVDLPVLSE